MYELNTLSHIDLEITSYCNARCPQCPRYNMFGEIRKELNIQHLDKNILFNLPIKKMPNLRSINLCGNFGDALMHPDLDEILNFFNTQDITISTNGSLRNKEWWSLLGKRKNIKKVIFGLDGIGETHEIYRRNTSYTKVIENAKSFINNGGYAVWQFIIFDHNEHQIEDVKKTAKELGFKETLFLFSERFDISNKWKVYENNKHVFTLKHSSKKKSFRDFFNFQEVEKYTLNLMKQENILEKKITCPWATKKKIYIDRNGYVFPCCYMVGLTVEKNIEKRLFEKIVKNFKNIDLKSYSFEEILSGPVYREYFRKSLLSKKPHPTCIEWCNHLTGKKKLTEESIKVNLH